MVNQEITLSIPPLIAKNKRQPVQNPKVEINLTNINNPHAVKIAIFAVELYEIQISILSILTHVQ